MKKITAPTGAALHGPFHVDRPDGPWWVHGVLYTDNPGLIAWFTRKAGYLLEDAPDGPPAEHLAAVDQMRAHAATNSNAPAVATDHYAGGFNYPS